MISFYLGTIESVMLWFAISSTMVAIDIALSKALKRRWQTEQLRSENDRLRSAIKAIQNRNWYFQMRFESKQDCRAMFPQIEKLARDALVGEDPAAEEQSR